MPDGVPSCAGRVICAAAKWCVACSLCAYPIRPTEFSGSRCTMKRFQVNPVGSALLAGALSLAAPALIAGQEPRESPQNQSSTQARDNGQATAAENSFTGRITKANNGK